MTSLALAMLAAYGLSGGLKWLHDRRIRFLAWVVVIFLVGIEYSTVPLQLTSTKMDDFWKKEGYKVTNKDLDNLGKYAGHEYGMKDLDKAGVHKSVVNAFADYWLVEKNGDLKRKNRWHWRFGNMFDVSADGKNVAFTSLEAFFRWIGSGESKLQDEHGWVTK